MRIPHEVLRLKVRRLPGSGGLLATGMIQKGRYGNCLGAGAKIDFSDFCPGPQTSVCRIYDFFVYIILHA